MPDGTARLSAANRAALAVLCLVLAGSVGVRIYLHGQSSAPDEQAIDGGPVDLGDGAFLPRSQATSRMGRIAPCNAPVAVDFVSPTSPGGDAPSAADGRTSYVYRGRVLDGRLAPLELRAMHYMHRALGLLRIGGRTGSDELAVKVVLPSGCDVSPDIVMGVLRREASGSR